MVVSSSQPDKEDSGTVTKRGRSGLFRSTSASRRITSGSACFTRSSWSTGLNAETHPVYDSPLHRSSNLCGTCHDVSLPFDCPDQDQTQECFPIERTWSEWLHSDFSAMGEAGNCQSCHMSGPLNGHAFGAPCEGADALGHLNDIHVHDLTGGNDFVPRAITWMKERYDDGAAVRCASLTPGTPEHDACVAAEADFQAALEDLYPPLGEDPFEDVDLEALELGRERVARNMARSAYLSGHVDPLDPSSLLLRVENRTGHKLPTGYPEGRRMWLNVRFYDAAGSLLAESGRYDPATASLWHDQNVDALPGPKAYDVVDYTDASGTSLGFGRPTKVWEGRAERTSGPIEFHFVLNDHWVLDNRIPPRGWEPAQYAAKRASPVIPTAYGTAGWQSDYLDSGGAGEHWDEAAFPIPVGTDRAELVLYYQTASREYVEALVADNPGTLTAGGYNRATLLQESWEAVGRSEPAEMTREVVAVVDADSDGLPDGWSSLHGLLGGANDDPDADGLNNYQELLWGSDPNVPAPEDELRKPVDIVLVLDLSGSMNDPAPNSAIPKIDLLKDSVALFLETWSDYAVPDDRIAVVTFRTTAEFLAETPGLTSFVASSGAVRTAVDALSASGWTAMGAGLYMALEELDCLAPNLDDSRTRHVLLFSNGMQNRSPIVADDSSFGATHLEIRDPDPGLGDISVTGDSNPGLPSATGTLPRASDSGAFVHTIGLGVAQDPGGTPWHETLKEIAVRQGGAHVFVTDAFELEGTFLEGLVQTLRGDTLEYVLERELSMAPGATESISIPVNATATKFSVAVSWSQQGDLSPQLELLRPDGTPESIEELVRVGRSYAILNRFLEDADRHPELYGNWTLRLALQGKGDSFGDAGHAAKAGEGLRVRVHALLDDEDVHYDFHFNGPDLRVGVPLRVSASATQGDRRLLHADEVRVTMHRPARWIGSELARSKASLGADVAAAIDPDLLAQPLGAKLYAAFSQPGFAERIGAIQSSWELTDDGQHGDAVAADGRFERQLFTPQLPGHYKLEFRMAAYALDGSPVERIETRSVYVRPAKVTLDSSSVHLAEGVGGPELELRPSDVFGNLLGPGFASKLRLSVGGALVPLADRLDGSYVASLPASFQPSTPVELSVWNELVHAGPIPEPESRSFPLWLLVLIALLLLVLLALALRNP